MALTRQTKFSKKRVIEAAKSASGALKLPVRISPHAKNIPQCLRRKGHFGPPIGDQRACLQDKNTRAEPRCQRQIMQHNQECPPRRSLCLQRSHQRQLMGNVQGRTGLVQQ